MKRLAEFIHLEKVLIRAHYLELDKWLEELGISLDGMKLRDLLGGYDQPVEGAC